MIRAAVVLLLLVLLPSTVHAQKRVALVIGNSAYRYAPELVNPKNDATDVAAALAAQGFQVITGFDLDRPALERKIGEFAAALQRAEVGLFFYGGHGLQVSGRNYLVPVDAQLKNAWGLELEMMRVEVVQGMMENATQTNIIFLDACRDNPLARNLASAMGTRSTQIGRGLAITQSGVGTLISFSTEPGSVALDGRGRNSPFAGALVKHISSSNDDLSALLIDVRNDVIQETLGKQVPWEHSALRGRFYFKEQRLAAPPRQAQGSEAERAWNLAKETKSIAVLEMFIARYKDTFYAALAAERLQQLKQNIAMTAPAGPPPQNPSVGSSAPTAPARARLFTMRPGEEASGAYASPPIYDSSMAGCENACVQSATCTVYTFNKMFNSCHIYVRAAFKPSTQYDSGVRN
jgi:uncharacterized caspase-like protein